MNNTSDLISSIKNLSFDNLSYYDSKWDSIDNQFIEAIGGNSKAIDNCILYNKLYNYIFNLYIKQNITKSVIPSVYLFKNNKTYQFHFTIADNKLNIDLLVL